MTGRPADPLDVGGKPPYRIAGNPPGIISDDDYDVTDEVLSQYVALVNIARAAEGVDRWRPQLERALTDLHPQDRAAILALREALAALEEKP